MDCSSCGTENRSGRKFCSNCGSPLAVACPACGAGNERSDRFCGECGTPLRGDGTSSPPPAQPTGAAERRLVSVLFADLVGFTSLSEDRDPEDVRELLSRYFEGARDIIARYGGVVEKFIGDAVMAVWGTPVAHEDDAERAVRAALELVDAVAALGSREGATDLRLRAGVLTGEAAVTIGAEGQGMVAGDLVNTASRLQSAAEPGRVLVGEATYRAAKQAISFEEAGERHLKGKEAPVPAWRAVQVVAARQGFRRTEGLEPPFVGRGEELRTLKEALHAVGRERRPRLVSVTGIAGIGKSRLGWELFKYVDGLEKDVWWHHGRSPAYGDGVTFWALGEMVRMRARIAETEGEESTRRKLGDAVFEHVADPEERSWVEARLAQLLGLETGSVEREELFSAWRTFFERIADRGPTVLLFEDLHWADPGQLDFIEHVLEWSRHCPILIVTLARPELMDRRPTWGAGLRNFQSIHLRPLPDGDMRELLTGMVPGLPEPLLVRVLERAEGVPMYAVETVRMLLDQGLLLSQDGGFRLAGEIDRLEVPDTLHALVASRLDALSAEDRTLLQDATVLGQTFTLEALAGVTGGAPDQLEGRLRGLVRKEILAFDADPRSPERGQYGFVQSLLKEVAYQTLSRGARRERHLRIARYWEGMGDDELAGITATHYLEAYRASSDDQAKDVGDRARQALAAAAERASSLGSHDQARAYFEQAVDITQDPAGRASLLESASASAKHAGLVGDAERLIREAIAGYRSLGDRAGAARATSALGSVLLELSRVPEAIEVLRGALDELEGLEGEPFLAQLYAELGRAYMLGGQAEPSIEWCDGALALAEPAGLVPVIAEALITKGAALSVAHRGQEALALLRGVLTLAEEQGLLGSQIRARQNLSFQLAWFSPPEALSVARGGLDLARKFGFRGAEAWLAQNAITAAFRVGEWDWVAQTLDELTESRVPKFVWASLEPVGIVLRAFREDADGLEEVLARWRVVVVDSGSPQDAANVEISESHARLAAGDFEAAYRLARSAITLDDSLAEAIFIATRAAVWLRDPRRAEEVLRTVDGMHGPWIDLTRSTTEAGLAVLRGTPEKGSDRFRGALRGWRELGVRFDEALCLLDLVLLLPEDPEAADALARARGILEGLGARAFLRVMEGVIGATAEASPVPAP